MPEPIHLLLAAAIPSVERRFASNAMEAAARRAMGATASTGWKVPLLAPKGMWNRLEQDIVAVRNMKPGWRKSLNEFFMHEGPGTIVYLPTEHGMRVGEALGKITKDLPLDARNNLADVISMDPEKATKALHRYDNVVSEAQKLLGKLPAKDMSAEEIAQTLHRANEIADKTMPVVNALRPAWDFVQENPVATAATLGGGTGFLAGRLHDKTAAPTEDYPLVNAFQRGFENAVQK